MLSLAQCILQRGYLTVFRRAPVLSKPPCGRDSRPEPGQLRVRRLGADGPGFDILHVVVNDGIEYGVRFCSTWTEARDVGVHGRVLRDGRFDLGMSIEEKCGLQSEVAAPATAHDKNPVQVRGNAWPLLSEDGWHLLVQPLPEIANIFEDIADLSFRGQAVSG